jgi:hypothetical protein
MAWARISWVLELDEGLTLSLPVKISHVYLMILVTRLVESKFVLFGIIANLFLAAFDLTRKLSCQ